MPFIHVIVKVCISRLNSGFRENSDKQLNWVIYLLNMPKAYSEKEWDFSFWWLEIGISNCAIYFQVVLCYSLNCVETVDLVGNVLFSKLCRNFGFGWKQMVWVKLWIIEIMCDWDDMGQLTWWNTLLGSRWLIPICIYTHILLFLSILWP